MPITDHTAYRTRHAATLPATCNVGDVFIDDTGGGQGFYACFTINTWSGPFSTSAGITNSAGANVVPKSNGTNLIASPITAIGDAINIDVSSVGGLLIVSADEFGSSQLRLGADITGAGAPGNVQLGDVTNAVNGTKIVINAAVGTLDFVAPLSITLDTKAGGSVGIGDVNNLGGHVKLLMSQPDFSASLECRAFGVGDLQNAQGSYININDAVTPTDRSIYEQTIGEWGAGDVTGAGNNTKIEVNDNSKAIELFASTDSIVLDGTAHSIALSSSSLGFYGTSPVSKPEVPAVSTPQDIVDALLTLGLITQA